MTPAVAEILATGRARRELMVEAQLAGRGIGAPAVLRAMADVPREDFAPDDVAEHASDDAAIFVRPGLLLPQPYLIGVILQALEVDPRHQVLEVGTGTGYLTALLATLASHVLSIDPNPSGPASARSRVARSRHPSAAGSVGA